MIAYKREALKGYESQPEAEQRRRAEVIEVANVAINVLGDFITAVKIHFLAPVMRFKTLYPKSGVMVHLMKDN